MLATTFNYNATRHASTGYTPFELMFARHPRFIADLSSSPPSHSHNISHYHRYYATIYRTYQKLLLDNNNIQHQQSLLNNDYDQNRSNPKYSIGQSVLIRNRNSTMNKFSPRFVGPYTIINQLNDKTYIVQK